MEHPNWQFESYVGKFLSHLSESTQQQQQQPAFQDMSESTQFLVMNFSQIGKLERGQEITETTKASMFRSFLALHDKSRSRYELKPIEKKEDFEED
jgi:hypothetical protein